MAAKITEIVKQRGRAYRCVPCGFSSRKCRMEEHYYKRHVSEHEVPFQCIVCQFRTGDNSKYVKHQDSPAHTAKVDPVSNLVALQESSTPKYMVMGQDVVKLSREESAEHWLAVGCTTDDEDNDIEDIRPQLLRHEPMNFTPPSRTEGARPKEVALCKDAEVQTDKEPPQPTEPSAMELAVRRIDSNFSQMYAQTSDALQTIYNLQENMKVINRRQEEVILRLEKRLDKYEEKERERASASSSTRRDDRRKDDRDSRKEDRGRSRSGHRH